MNIQEMSLRECGERRAQIKSDIEVRNESMTIDEMKAYDAELDQLAQREKDIQSVIETREAMLKKALESGVTVTEPKKEEREMNEQIHDVTSKEYREAYLLNLQGRATPEQRTAVSAAAVIPTITLNKIYEKVEQTSVLFPFISKSNLPGLLSIPVENAKNDASWVAIGTAATDGADSFAAVTLSAYKLIKTVELTADNVAASIDAFETFIVNALAKKIARAVDAAICVGDGSSKATGLLASGIITNTGTYTKAAMTFADLNTIISKINTEYRRNAKFVMPSAVYYSDVVPALASKGLGVDQQNALQMKILGYDVILDDNMTADSIVFGDLSYYHWNWAKDVTVEFDDSVAFRTGSRVYRAFGLADGKVVNIAAFTAFTRAAS